MSRPADAGLSPELALRLQAAVLQRYAQAEQYYLKSFPRPQVRTDLRGRSAGMAVLQANCLRFNPVLLRENESSFLQEVVAHEVAHLLAWKLHGRNIRPHGPEWQQIMQQVFVLEPRRTHAFDIRRAARQSYVYTCACPGHEHSLTSRRHNKILQGQAYLCTRCNTRLSFLRQDDRVTDA